MRQLPIQVGSQAPAVRTDLSRGLKCRPRPMMTTMAVARHSSNHQLPSTCVLVNANLSYELAQKVLTSQLWESALLSQELMSYRLSQGYEFFSISHNVKP